MEADASVAGLKARLQPLTGVPAGAQKLMFKKLLKDSDVIGDSIQVCLVYVLLCAAYLSFCVSSSVS